MHRNKRKEEYDKLFAEYQKLIKKTAGKRGKELQSLRIEIGRMDAELGRIRQRSSVFEGEEIAVLERSQSITEQESSYSGPTPHGQTIGEGCYWNKRGHH